MPINKTALVEPKMKFNEDFENYNPISNLSVFDSITDVLVATVYMFMALVAIGGDTFGLGKYPTILVLLFGSMCNFWRCCHGLTLKHKAKLPFHRDVGILFGGLLFIGASICVLSGFKIAYAHAVTTTIVGHGQAVMHFFGL